MPSRQTPPAQRRLPVYDAYFADPFVWRHGNQFFAVGTGRLEADGRTNNPGVFPVLTSSDLTHWRPLGNALVRPSPEHGTHFWAPEVACDGDRFYLYYSVGFEDRLHQLRVASSDSPEGPYSDLGSPLVSPGEYAFAIDPHPFRAADGSWWLFYARDFLDAADGFRPGTGIVVAPMRSMTKLEHPGNLVVRARWDWQLFQRNRAIYGQTFDWHTLEGPSVLQRAGRFYCFYSGGRWETPGYGVDYVVAERIAGPYEDTGYHQGPRVLQTAPGTLLGPGHNSFIEREPGEHLIVYHAWDAQMSARRMFIDRLEWTSDGPHCAPMGTAAEKAPRTR